MESNLSFKFSGDELKKINVMLPRGYKFVTREELSKQKTQKVAVKKKLPPPPPLPVKIEAASEPAPIVVPPQIQPKVKIEKEDIYVPENKKSIPPPLLVPTEQNPAGTCIVFVERIKKHPAYKYFYSHRAPFELGADLSLKFFEERIREMGEAYTIQMYAGDLLAYFLEIYKYSGKTSSDYRQATELEDYLLKLLKLQKIETRKGDIGKGQGGRKKAAPVKTYQPLSSYKMATPRQKRQLGMMIRKLSSQNLYHIINILFESTEVKEYSFDLDNIHIKKFREIEEYVKKCIEKITDWDPKILEDDQFENQEQFVIDNDDD